MACIDKETAVAYVSGFLEAAEADACASHLVNCRTCRTVVEEASDLLDQTRRTLTLGDDVFDGSIPPVEAVRHRQPISFRRRLASVVQETHERALMRGWTVRLMVAAAAVVIVSAVFYIAATRDTLHAAEILSRADRTMVNARTIPDRIVHRAWKASLINGYGPLPDGDYREQYWWDNVQGRYVYACYDQQGRLREGTWHLADGSFYNFQAYDLNKPALVIGPTSAEILTEIATLPGRQAVEAYYLKMRRPFYALAEESQDRTANELKRIAEGRIAESSVDQVVFPSGQKLYRVTTRSDASQRAAKVIHWDVTRLILDGSYLTTGMQITGYRSDGQIYSRTRVLTEEQVFGPDETDLSVFTPAAFPAGTTVQRVSARRRVELLQQSMNAGGNK